MIENLFHFMHLGISMSLKLLCQYHTLYIFHTIHIIDEVFCHSITRLHFVEGHLDETRIRCRFYISQTVPGSVTPLCLFARFDRFLALPHLKLISFGILQICFDFWLIADRNSYLQFNLPALYLCGIIYSCCGALWLCSHSEWVPRKIET